MFCPRCHREFETDHRFCPYDGDRLAKAPSIKFIKSEDTEETGSVLGGRYEIRGFIAKGAMARIYVAEDLESGEPVAIKILDAHARSNQSRERFLREAKAAARIEHENIVKILDLGIRPDRAPYLVLEFLHGESLGQMLRRDGFLAEDIALPILKQAASGLAAAHRAGIIHRDVKPDNVFLIGEPGDPYAVKLLDFGLAKMDAQSDFTQVGVAIGTMEYMAPEQVVTDRPDARTDVYGLGMVMYRIFTGQLPFRANEDVVLLAHQLLLPIPAPTKQREGIDPRVELVIAKATQKRPENRYASMDAMLLDIERLLGERSGELIAKAEPADPDVYEPKSPFARSAAKFFYERLGMPAPEWEA